MSLPMILEEAKGDEDLSCPKKLLDYVSFGMAVDCMFLIGSDVNTAEKIEGHKVVFAQASPVFKSMLFGNFKESEKPFEIALPSDDPIVFRQMRHLIYNIDCTMELDRFSLCAEDSIELYRMCNKYLIKPLTDSIVYYMLKLVKNDNDEDLIKLLSFADESKNTFLLNRAWKHIHLLTHHPKHLNQLSQSLFTDYIIVHRYRAPVPWYNLYGVIESYLADNDLIPKCLFDASIPKSDEERKKLEITASFFTWLDVNALNTYTNDRGLPSPFRKISECNFYKFMKFINSKY